MPKRKPNYTLIEIEGTNYPLKILNPNDIPRKKRACSKTPKPSQTENNQHS